jgi:ZIP family zinc transporter
MAGLGAFPMALAASLVAAAMAAVGIIAVSLREEWAQANRSYFAALASGVLLSTALFILPEAFAGSELAPMAALAGYFTLFVLGRFARRPEGRAIAAFFAIAAHSTIDGMEYGLLFAANDTAGFLGAGGLILHEFAEGVLLYLILHMAGVPRVLAVVLSLLGAAVTTPLGALATTAMLPNLGPAEFSIALAFAAGALLFVGASQLPEEFGDLSFRSAVATYAFGAAIALVLMWSAHQAHPGGDHDHDDHHGPERSAAP